MSISLVADVNKLVKGYEKAEKATTKFVSGVKTAIGILATGAVFNQLKNAILETSSAIDTMGKTAARIGITVEALQELDFVASQSGIQMQTLEKALQTLAIRSDEAAQGTGEAVKAFERLGINAKEISQLSIDRQLEVVAGAMEKIGTQNEKIALASDILGTRGIGVLQTMNDGMQGLIDKRKEAREIGLFSQMDADNAAKLNDALDKLQRIAAAEFRKILVDLIPALIDFTTTVGPFLRFLGAFGNVTPGGIRRTVTESAETAQRTRNEQVGFSLDPNLTRDQRRQELQRRFEQLERIRKVSPEAKRASKEEMQQLKTMQSIEQNTRPHRQGLPQISLAPASGL